MHSQDTDYDFLFFAGSKEAYNKKQKRWNFSQSLSEDKDVLYTIPHVGSLLFSSLLFNGLKV